MKTFDLFVVKLEKRFNDTIKTDSGLELYVDTKFNEFEHRITECIISFYTPCPQIIMTIGMKWSFRTKQTSWKKKQKTQKGSKCTSKLKTPYSVLCVFRECIDTFPMVGLILIHTIQHISVAYSFL